MVEKWHAAFDRCRHAHVVLLHQKLDEIGLDVGVEQALKQRSGGLFPVIEYVLIGDAGTEFVSILSVSSSVCSDCAERGEEVVKVKTRPKILHRGPRKCVTACGGRGANPCRSGEESRR